MVRRNHFHLHQSAKLPCVTVFSQKPPGLEQVSNESYHYGATVVCNALHASARLGARQPGGYHVPTGISLIYCGYGPGMLGHECVTITV